MRKKAIGFLGGQFGDILTTIGAQRVFSEDFPEYDFTLAVSRKYSEILALFKDQKYIKDLHTWEGYDSSWPTENDINFLKEKKYDMVFNPMQGVGDANWFNKTHQVSLCCERYGLRLPDTNEIFLNKNFKENLEYKNSICLSVFPNEGIGIKALTLSRAQNLAKILKSKGHRVLQLCGRNDPKIDGAEIVQKSFVEVSEILCCCKLLITGDTSISWIASAYKVPTVGLYAYGYHAGAKTSKNWQPINPNAIYLESETVSGIEDEHILRAVLNATS